MRILSGIIAAVLLLAGCSEKPPVVQTPEAGPKLLSCSIENGAADVTGEELAVIFTFDQNVKTDPYKHSNVAIDNGASVAKVRAYNENVTVDIALLEQNGRTYTLVIPEGVILGFKNHHLGGIHITDLLFFGDVIKVNTNSCNQKRFFSKNPHFNTLMIFLKFAGPIPFLNDRPDVIKSMLQVNVFHQLTHVLPLFKVLP